MRNWCAAKITINYVEHRFSVNNAVIVIINGV